ncbi:MAG TPA: hypothetical protein VHA30_00675 [Patescibacteria group bacterium]|nr:hypothetical protein [Patescibacteria group bacterium]
MNKTKQKFFFFAGVLALLAFSYFSTPLSSQARGLVPCGGYTATGAAQPPCTVSDLFLLVAVVTNWLISVAGLYAVFQIVGAGFWLTTTMGNEESITKWKKALTEAVVGFVFVMIAFILVNTAVNYILLGGDPNKMIDITKPLCFLNPGASGCTKGN